MKTYLKLLAAGALALAAALPASAQVRVGVRIGEPAPVYVRQAPPAYYYGAPHVVHRGYYDSRYDVRARRHDEWRRREWLRREEWRREEWRRQQWRHEHRRHDRGWDGRR